MPHVWRVAFGEVALPPEWPDWAPGLVLVAVLSATLLAAWLWHPP